MSPGRSLGHGGARVGAGARLRRVARPLSASVPVAACGLGLGGGPSGVGGAGSLGGQDPGLRCGGGARARRGITREWRKGAGCGDGDPGRPTRRVGRGTNAPGPGSEELRAGGAAVLWADLSNANPAVAGALSALPGVPRSLARRGRCIPRASREPGDGRALVHILWNQKWNSSNTNSSPDAVLNQHIEICKGPLSSVVFSEMPGSPGYSPKICCFIKEIHGKDTKLRIPSSLTGRGPYQLRWQEWNLGLITPKLNFGHPLRNLQDCQLRSPKISQTSLDTPVNHWRTRISYFGRKHPRLKRLLPMILKKNPFLLKKDK
nr:uncharacterized protein LOC105487422 [Macaca nemestrina]